MVSLMGEYLAQGYDGVFLDTIDTVYAYPETVSGMIDLIESLREAYPEALLVQNRGFTVIHETAPFVDAVMLEDLSTGYNFDSKEYTRIDNSEEADLLQDLVEETPLVVLVLDYVPEGDTKTAQDVAQIADDYGFISSISTIALDDIPDYGFAPPRQAADC